MKKIILVAVIIFSAIGVKAQQPPQPPPMTERLKRTNEILEKEMQLSTSQKAAISSTFEIFFMAQDKLKKDNPPPPPPEPDPKVKAAMDKLEKERDESLKKIFTTAQYQKYMEVEKKLHPPKAIGQGERNGPPINKK